MRRRGERGLGDAECRRITNRREFFYKESHNMETNRVAVLTYVNAFTLLLLTFTEITK